MSRYNDDRAEAQRKASLPMLRFQLDSMVRYIADLQADLDDDVMNWEQAARNSIALHQDIDEFGAMLQEVVPETVNHTITMEMLAKRNGVSEDHVMLLENGEQLAKLITEGILQPADAEHIVEEAKAKGIDLTLPDGFDPFGDTLGHNGEGTDPQ